MYSLIEDSDSFCLTAAESKISTTSSAAEQIARSTEIGGTGLRIVQPLKAVTRHGMSTGVGCVTLGLTMFAFQSVKVLSLSVKCPQLT